MATVRHSSSILVARPPDIRRVGHTRHKTRGTRHGLTLIEVVVAMSVAFVVMLTAAMLVSSGYKGWTQVYNNANCEARLGAIEATVALGAIGRKSNKIDYRLYSFNGSKYTRVGVDPASHPDDILTGQAVEFRYWDTELDADLMNPDVNATAYALFYLEGDGQLKELKVDYGPYDPPDSPGGINSSGHRNTTNVSTATLAKDVNSVEFSHTAKNTTGDGYGCVRMKLVITDTKNTTDTKDDSSKTILAATFMRNVWPQ
jgi:hypothetical protein